MKVRRTIRGTPHGRFDAKTAQGDTLGVVLVVWCQMGNKRCRRRPKGPHDTRRAYRVCAASVEAQATSIYSERCLLARARPISSRDIYLSCAAPVVSGDHAGGSETMVAGDNETDGPT
ncbi:hypothetical protein MRX96_020155 [Rhipicephalus microplus]